MLTANMDNDKIVDIDTITNNMVVNISKSFISFPQHIQCLVHKMKVNMVYKEESDTQLNNFIKFITNGFEYENLIQGV